ncbi:hypothetical protein RI367_001131 [Sorochytrium milnesiophthora]
MTFIVVKHGANAQRLFNANCLCIVLLTFIKESLGLDFGETIDLADESGEVLDLAGHPREYAKKYLEPRGVYTLIKVLTADAVDDGAKYQPLVDAPSESFKLTARRQTKRFADSKAFGHGGGGGGGGTGGGGGGGGGGSNATAGGGTGGAVNAGASPERASVSGGQANAGPLESDMQTRKSGKSERKAASTQQSLPKTLESSSNIKRR